MDLPTPDAYTVAIYQHGDHPITITMNLLQLTMLVGSLQLALRHPHYPASMRPYVETFVQEAITNVGRLSPVITEVMQAGNDPEQDL